MSADNSNSNSTTSLLTSIGTMLAGAGIFFYIGLEVGKIELKTREDLKSMDLAHLSSQVTNASKALDSASTEFYELLVNNQTYQKMKSDWDAKENEIYKLKDIIKAKNSQIDRQTEALSKVHNDLNLLRPKGKEYLISEKNSVRINADLLVGVTSIYPSSANIKVNSSSAIRDPGDVWTETNGISTCEISVISLEEPNSVKISVYCRD